MLESFISYLSAHPLAELALIVVVLLGVGYIMQLLRQPSIVGYILAGIILSPQLNGLVTNQEGVQLFAHIGIALLLFLVGLGLSVKVIKEVGKISLIAGVGQVVFTSAVGMGIALLMGNDWLTALFLAIGLTFSSTIVIVKLISDRRDTNKLYGKISLGVLIVQDVIAMLILIAFAFISTMQQTGDISSIMQTLGSIAVAIVLVRLITKYVVKKLIHTFAQSQEYLLLFSVGRALLLAAGFEYVGLTMEAGALIAGMTLAESSERFLIISKIKTLRDFFIALFFVYMGSNLVFDGLSLLRADIIVLSFFVLIGNPIIVFFLMRSFKYDRRTAFMTGLTVAQISEFSFIVVGMGLSLGLIENDTLLTTITFVALITMAGSSYMFYYADEIINRLGRTFPDIQSDSVDEEQLADHYDVIVVGYGQHGQKLCHRLDASLQILVLEHDPRAVKHAVIPPNVTLIHADVTEDEIRRDVEQYSARYVIVTSSEPHVNISSHHYNKHLDRHIVGRANNEHDAIDLYESGIDIVHVIHDAAVDHTVQLINANPHPEQISTHTHSHLVELRTYTSEELFQSMSEKSG